MNAQVAAPCDPGMATATRPVAARHPRMTLAATILGSSIAFIDGSVVNVALPALQSGLDVPDATLPWTINAYLLPLGALILLGGGAGDRYGRRRLFQAGLLLFAAVSLLCAASPTVAHLLVGRALQGIGAALLLPNSLAILGASFEGEAQGKAVGTWAAVGALAGALGPLLGGWLVDSAGWRMIFLINPPIALVAGWLTHRCVGESGSGETGPLDWAGATAGTVALLAITWALTASSGNHRSGWLWAIGAGGAAALVLFVWIEHRRRERAIMPLALFATTSFAGLTLLTFFLYASLGGLLVLLPFLLIRIAGYSAIAAGAAILPLPIVIGLGSRLMGRMTGRYGGRWLLTIGALVVACGLALFLRTDGAVDYWRDIFPPVLLVAIGMGITVAPLTTSVIASVDRRHVGAASGFNSAVARIAGLLATALLGYVWGLQGSSAAFISGFRIAALVGALCAIAAALSAWALVRAPRA